MFVHKYHLKCTIINTDLLFAVQKKKKKKKKTYTKDNILGSHFMNYNLSRKDR